MSETKHKAKAEYLNEADATKVVNALNESSFNTVLGLSYTAKENIYSAHADRYQIVLNEEKSAGKELAGTYNPELSVLLKKYSNDNISLYGGTMSFSEEGRTNLVIQSFTKEEVRKAITDIHVKAADDAIAKAKSGSLFSLNRVLSSVGFEEVPEASFNTYLGRQKV